MGGARMSVCDHRAMGVAGEDRAFECPGCGQVVGRFTAPDGSIYTTQAARDAWRPADAPTSDYAHGA
jgi:hypothetical protein